MSRCVDLGLTPREVIEAAFIPLLIERSLLLCTFDERRSDVSLSHEPGCFTRLVAVPEDLGRLLREARTAPALNLAFSDVRRGLARSTPAEPAGSGVLLNTDYLGEPAWVGGDDWTPLGFVDMGTPEVDVAMSVTPVLRESDGAVTLDWTREAASLAELVASEALAAIERVVEINDGTIEHRELAALQDATFSF